MSSTVTANDGTQLPLDDLAQTVTYVTIAGNSYPQTLSVQYPAQSTGVLSTFTQTITYTGTTPTNISKWIKQ